MSGVPVLYTVYPIRKNSIASWHIYLRRQNHSRSTLIFQINFTRNHTTSCLPTVSKIQCDDNIITLEIWKIIEKLNAENRPSFCYLWCLKPYTDIQAVTLSWDVTIQHRYSHTYRSDNFCSTAQYLTLDKQSCIPTGWHPSVSRLTCLVPALHASAIYFEQFLRETETYEDLPVNYNKGTMFAEENMQRMSISTTDSEIEDVTSFTVYPSLERHLLSYVLDGVILRIIGVASIILLLYALLTVQTHQIGNRSKYDDRIFEVGKQSIDRPHNLQEKLRSVAMTALEDGALNPIVISRIDIVIDNNFEVSTFLLTCCLFKLRLDADSGFWFMESALFFTFMLCHDKMCVSLIE